MLEVIVNDAFNNNKILFLYSEKYPLIVPVKKNIVQYKPNNVIVVNDYNNLSFFDKIRFFPYFLYDFSFLYPKNYFNFSLSEAPSKEILFYDSFKKIIEKKSENSILMFYLPLEYKSIVEYFLKKSLK